MKITYKTNFQNTWGGVNALTKQVVKDLLVMINLPYSKELAGFIRYEVFAKSGK